MGFEEPNQPEVETSEILIMLDSAATYVDKEARHLSRVKYGKQIGNLLARASVNLFSPLGLSVSGIPCTAIREDGWLAIKL